MVANNWVQQERARLDRERIFDAVVTHLDTHGKSPSRGYLAARLGLVDSTIRRHIDSLVAEGRLTKQGHQLRP